MIQRVVVAKPPLGAKAWLMDRRGVFVLEEQPAVIHHVTCTHAGSGSLRIFDGGVIDGRIEGRPIFRQAVTAMGVWHLSAGVQHGLVLENVGRGADSMSAIASLVWQTRMEPTRLQLGPRESVRLRPGRQVVSSADCVLYSVMISKAGNGQLSVWNGEGSPLWRCPSLFAGSFLLEHVFARGGLVVDLCSPVQVEIEIIFMPILGEGETDGR